MKKTSKTMKISVLTTVGALALLSGAFTSSASATDTPSPTPTVSPAPNTNPLDIEVNDDLDVQAVIGDDQSLQDLLNAALDAQLNDENAQGENVDVQENDTDLDELEAEDQGEIDSFNQDITQAEQNGNSEDAADLKIDVSIVAGVSAPEIKAVAADDTQAHALITGVPAK